MVGGFNCSPACSQCAIDLGVIDAFANGLATVTQRAAAGVRRLETGYVRNYALSIFVGVVVIIGYLVLR